MRVSREVLGKAVVNPIKIKILGHEGKRYTIILIIIAMFENLRLISCIEYSPK